MYSPKISKRLLAAADFVRPSSFIADVGSDHAYLPIYLCSLGKIRGAVASDINEGPVARAQINIAASHLQRKITTLETNGLCGIESYHPDDIFICGMGGELISDIIAAAPWTKSKDIRLILQPMTHAEKLRDFLNREGYAIIGERIVKEDKLYTVICAEYRGVSEEYSRIDLIFGKILQKKRTPEFLEYAEYVKRVYTVKRDGKRSAGVDVSEEEYYISEIDRILAK
jgi:tRNA (adenine22-N1)-methyltransferase